MGRLLAGVSFLGTPSTGHPDVADGSTTALTNGDGFRPVAGPAARTRRRRAQETLGREFYEVLTRQGRRRPVRPVAAARVTPLATTQAWPYVTRVDSVDGRLVCATPSGALRRGSGSESANLEKEGYITRGDLI